MSQLSEIQIYAECVSLGMTPAGAAMICLPSGSFYKAISIHTNSGGTGWISPTVYTSNRYSLSGTTVTVTGAYSFRPAVGYIWYAW